MRKLYSAAFGMMAFLLFPFATLADDENIVLLSGSVETTELEAVTDHHFEFTTPGLTAGDVVSFLYTATDVEPQNIGISFEDITFSEDEDALEALFSIDDGMEFAFHMLATADLAGGTYTVTATDVTNPSEDITVYPTATTGDISEGNNEDFTRATSGISFGEGTEGEEGGEVASCEEQREFDDLVDSSETLETIVLGDKVHMTWGEQEDATSYVVAYSLNEQLTDPVTVATGVTDLEYWVEDLDLETIHYMTIRGDDENTCQVGYANQEVTTEAKVLTDQKMKKAEFTFPKKKRKKKKFNIKPQLGDDEEVIQRLEYQVFKGKKVKKAKRIGKKVRKQKNKNLGNAITIKGKNVEAGTYYWVRMRKVYTIGDDVVKTKYSGKKRVKTAGTKVVTE